jgi:hypothetical protein
MQRREFIKLVGVAAGTWPLSARAQKAGTKIPRIGYIGTTPRPPDEAFRQRLLELGYNEGENIVIEIPLDRAQRAYFRAGSRRPRPFETGCDPCCRFPFNAGRKGRDQHDTNRIRGYR